MKNLKELINLAFAKRSNEKPKGIVKPSRKMGYLSTVEEARKTLENIFKLEDTKES